MDSCQWHLQWHEFSTGEDKSLGLPLQTLPKTWGLATTNPDGRTLSQLGWHHRWRGISPRKDKQEKKAKRPTVLFCWVAAGRGQALWWSPQVHHQQSMQTPQASLHMLAPHDKPLFHLEFAFAFNRNAVYTVAVFIICTFFFSLQQQ